MCRNPLYFFKSKHGVYQFRYSFPLSLYRHLNIQREIKISLRTKDRAIAIRRHLIVLTQVESIIKNIKSITMNNPKIDKNSLQSVIDNHKQKIVVDDLRDQTENMQIETLHLTREIERQKQELKNKDQIINTLSSGLSLNVSPPRSISLANAIVEYVKLQLDRKIWGSKVERQRKGYLSVFADIIGQHEDISILNKDTITMYQRTLRNLPKNVNKFYKKPEDVTLRPTHYKNIADSEKREKLSATGLESHFNTVKPFLTWCVDAGYLDNDHRKILLVGKREIQKTKITILPFSPDHLSKIFTSYIYSDHRLQREKPSAFQFWMPILGLYTGARESEIANLRLSDIKTINDVLYIDINDDHEGKTLKTESSRRKVPIAQAILDVGFESYFKDRKNNSTTKDSPLFALPEHIDGLSRAVSRWFNQNFKKKVKLTTTASNTKVCFHSFRHTFINKLGSTKVGNDLVPDRMVKEIVGHEMGDVTNDVYGHEHDYTLIKEVIDSIDYGIDLNAINYSRFLERKLKK